jgi:Right handed beta helix region
MKALLAALAMAAVLFAARGAYAEPALARCTIFVAFTGSDRNSGTEFSPFRSVQHGIDAARAGDTICVGDGVYREHLVMQHSGRESAWITLAAMHRRRATIAPPNHGEHAININAQSYIAIRGLVIDGGMFGIVTSGGGHHWLISDVEVRNAAASGIQLNDGDYITIEDSVVHDCASQWNGSGSGVSIFMPHQFDNAPGDHIVIRRTMSFHNWNPPGGTDGNGFIFDNFRQSGYTAHALAENLVGYGNGGACLKLTSASGVTARNITCYKDEQLRSGITWRGEVVVQDSRGNTIVNNILVADLAADWRNRAVMCAKSADNIFAGNLMYAGSAILPTLRRDDCPSKFEGNYQHRAPKMLNPPLDFGLSSASPAVGACAAGFAAPADDFNGARRMSTRCDLGALASEGE